MKRPREQRHRVRRLFVALFPYVRARLGRLGLVLLAAFGLTAIRIAEPWPLKVIVDTLFFDQPLPAALAPFFPADATGRLLAVSLAAIIVLALMAGLFSYWQRLLTSAVALEATTALRRDLYAKALAQPPARTDRSRLGELLTQLTADVRVLRESFVTLPVRVIESVMLLFGIGVVMLLLDWRLALPALMLPPVWLLLSGTTRRRLGRTLARQRMRDGAIASHAAEALSAMQVVQAFRAEARERDNFLQTERRSVTATREAARLGAGIQLISGLVMGGGATLVVGVASWQVLRGDLTPGELLVFIAYVRTFFQPLRELSTLSVRASRVSVAAERAAGLLKAGGANIEGERRAPEFRGDIRFDRVTVLGPDGRKILDDISLEIPAGRHVALTGPSGAGKSTLVSLLPRFLEPDGGRILIDERDIAGFRPETLRRQIAIVFQEPLLLSLSIAENIAYGRRGATLEDAIEAARSVGLDPLLAGLRKGYDTPVGERGGSLSGGERQAVAIARAMVRDAPILILDEPTTGLDPALAARLLDALNKLAGGRTVLSVSHDRRLVSLADREICLINGKIEGNYPLRAHCTSIS